MQLKKYLLNKLPAYAVVLFALGLTSCGSYQYVGQDSDGIYSEDELVEDVVQADTEANSTYYKNYFKEKSLEMDSNGNENDEVFVDIDSYEGSYSEDYVDTANVDTGYGAWGENSSEVSVNIYNVGFNNYWNRPYYGWNNFGWNRSYSGWNLGYGYGNFGYGGFYSPFWYSPYGYNYGYGGNPYYTGYYGRNGYGRNGVAYSSRRRGSVYGRNSALGRRVESSRRSNTTSTRTRTSSTPRVRTSTPRTRTSTPRVRTRTSTPRVRTTTPRTRTSTPRTTTPRVRTTTPRTKSSSPSRSSTRSSSGSSSRSSSGSSRRG
ncbi:hypothetical protein [Lacinutrix algicola]|uniref:hypothetical protein n=1 Tax=Lacinutrix algicola TaxID=342954 RepID=UPI0006E32749|nr:hypothetical protein [Lacinutrix algicola]